MTLEMTTMNHSISLSKSFYTTSKPSTISKELRREFHLRNVEIMETPTEYPDFYLVTVILKCSKKRLPTVKEFLQRFNAEI